MTTSARSRSGAEDLALGADPVDDPALGSERVPAPGLLEPVEQRLLARLEEEHLRVEAGRLELVEDREQVGEVVAAADVGDDRRAAHPAALEAEQLAERGDQPRREVVDAEEAASPRTRRSPPTCRRRSSR